MPDERREQLRQRVKYWSMRLDAQPRIVRVQRMTRKWGSCSTRGIITLADELADRTPAFQDFVIVHELLHLRVPNHGKIFRALMSVHLPGWRDHDILRRAGYLPDPGGDFRGTPAILRAKDGTRTPSSPEPIAVRSSQ